MHTGEDHTWGRSFYEKTTRMPYMRVKTTYGENHLARIPCMRVKTTHGEDHLARRLWKGYACGWRPYMGKTTLWEDYEKTTHAGENHFARILWKDHTCGWRPHTVRIPLMRVKTIHEEDHIAGRLREGHACRWRPCMGKTTLREYYKNTTYTGEDHAWGRSLCEKTTRRPHIGKITLWEDYEKIAYSSEDHCHIPTRNGRHVATIGYPWMGPNFSKLNQRPARHLVT